MRFASSVSSFERGRRLASLAVGERGVVYTPLNPEGQVFVHGEYWQAVSDEPIAKGESVMVLEVVDLKLRVRRAQ